MVRTPRCPRLALSALLVVGLAAVAGAQTAGRAVIRQWPSTAYYLGFATFPSAQAGQIRIAAGGTYSLYLNGNLVGTDADPATAEAWEVQFANRANTIAVVLSHDGGISPYGLFCVLQSADVLAVSSAADRTTPWFWTDSPLPAAAGAAWTKLALNRLAQHQEGGVSVPWTPVQAGTLAPAAFAAFADLDLTRAPSVAGFPGGVDGSREGLQLRSLDGVNTAFGSLSSDPNLVDGDVTSAVSFRRGATALLQSVETDLGRLVAIDRVRVVTQPPSSNSTYADNSLRGYSILVSKDGVNFIEVGARNRIEDYRETSVEFPPISARHVRLTLTEFSARDAAPRVGEMEVFGVGVAGKGTFRSPPLDLGTAAPKNFDRVTWGGQVPKDAGLTLRFRSGDDGVSWSDWSPWRSVPSWVLDVPEPRPLLQFEAQLETRDLVRGPRLDSLVVSYTEGGLPVAAAAASVAPGAVAIGADELFTYTLDVELDGTSAGVARVAVVTPYPAQLDAGAVQGLAGAAVDAANTYAANDTLVISLDPPLTTSTRLVIPFRTRLLSASHAFQGLLYAPGSSNPLRAATRSGDDPLTGAPFSTVVEATRFGYPVLSGVGAVPAMLTPNGDGVNDVSALGFVLGRVSEAPVRIEVYDLAGRRLRRLPAQLLRAGRFIPTGRDVDGLPGTWDGRDDAGELVTPGIYVFRIVAELEPTDEVASGLVVVAY